MEKILDSLSNEYKELVYVVQVHDTLIMFDELHEKLLNFEVSLHTKEATLDHLPANANPTYQNTNWHPCHSLSHNRGWR